MAEDGHWRERLEHFREMDGRLVEAGWFPTSDWWHHRIVEICMARPLTVVIRAGRRAGKSSTCARWAVSECTSGTWPVPPGDVGVYLIGSVNQKQAKARVKNCVDICKALEIPY